MDLDHDPDQVIDVIDDLVEQYNSIVDKEDVGFMAHQDADMKITTLKHIKRDVEHYG